MKISIIIPVYNGADTISQCLDALLAQDYPADDYEIIVVNDGSQDNTRSIVEEYSSVRLINLEKNAGRIIAREKGVHAASYENLLFVDARVIVAPNILTQIAKIDYQPLMAGEHGEDKYRSPFDTLFYLIRKKVYAPYFPQREWGEELWIDQQNFDTAPKGTTCLFCSRELFLKAIPQRKGKMVSDDTLLLRFMMERKKLLRHTAIKINYLQRTDFKSVLAHIYQRGPLFNDYYLRGPSRYYNIWRGILLAGAVFIGLGVYLPAVFCYALLGLAICLLGLALFLAENIKDFVIVLLYFPLVGLTFVAGILKGKLFSR